MFAKDGLLDDLKKALSEGILNAELDEHLDGERVGGSANRRNGHSQKSVLTGTSKMTLSIPRDRAGTSDPKLIPKYQGRFPVFDDKIFSMYARGMSVREIRGHLEELYGIDVSADLISAVPMRSWRRWRMAEPTAGSAGLLRANTGQNPRRRLCPQQGRLRCAWHSPGWHQGDTWYLDRADRGRQVLAARHDELDDCSSASSEDGE